MRIPLVIGIIVCAAISAVAQNQPVSKASGIRWVKVAAISLPWELGERTLDNVLSSLDEAGRMGADIACLPQECVDQAPEAIPGPSSQAIARKAAEYKMYVVGNLREKDGEKTYVTSFLCDRAGKIAGVYRKSHRMPEDAPISLGGDLPTFATDFGCIGLKIGSDIFFPEIDSVLRSRGASMVLWSTKPFAFRDENFFSQTLRGRAVQNSLYLVVSQYAGRVGYGGYPTVFSWTASWPLGRAQVYSPDGHTIADSGHAGGVALALVPQSKLGGQPCDGGYPAGGIYARVASKDPLPPPPSRASKRVIKAAVVELEYKFERIIEKLDECGRQGCDIVCLGEYIWYNSDEEVEKNRERNSSRLSQISEAAKRGKMYVLVSGELERGFNESVFYDREGREIDRYTKIKQTTSTASKYYKAGDRVAIYDLDFGRICVKICNDVNAPEIDRIAALNRVDLMLFPTLDGGPYSENLRFRDAGRAIDCGYYLLRAAPGAWHKETDYRSYILDPWGMILAESQLHSDNLPLVVVINLDNRPPYYVWPEELVKDGEMPDPVKRGVAEKELMTVSERTNRRVFKDVLRNVILENRRPELYCPRSKAKP